MNLSRRIIAGDAYHRTRVHDEKGQFAGWGEVARVPIHAVQALRRVVFGVHADKPWYCASATRRIDGLLRPDWTVIEFGSGMSTPWYGRRVASLLSVEHDRKWYEQIAQRLAAEHLSNVRYELRELTPRYYDISDYDDGSVDFVVVDGWLRPECVRAAIPRIRPGGWLYLDNSDMEIDNRWGGALRPAEGLVLEAAKEHEYFVGLVPGSISTTEGLLARL